MPLKHTFLFSAAILLSVSLSACSTSKSNLRGGLFNTPGEGGLLGTGDRSLAGESGSSQGPAEVQGITLDQRQFDIPIAYNEEVQEWVEYFTGRGRKHFQVYLDRRAEFAPMILPKLKAAGMPEDLLYLAMIESGFSTSAKSHAGAVGPWQFMKATGRMYGLSANWWYDERRDPMKSTDAAIEYLSRLYAEFGTWELACAAYNSGEGRIRSAIKRLRTKDFWTIARDRRAIRRETKDYVPKMMAAAIIGKNAERFGFRVKQPTDIWLQTQMVQIPKAENLSSVARAAGISKDTLLDLNPELMRCCTPPQKNYSLRLPKGEAPLRLAAAIDAGEIGRYRDFKRHVIRRGDSPSRIAKLYGTSVEAILTINELRNVRSLKPGTELLIPEAYAGRSGRNIASVESSAGSRKVVVRSKNTKSSADANHTKLTHVVRKGETLYGISRRYAVRVEDIKEWNAIRRAKNVRPGSRLKLYVRNEKI